jgi:hypothetical protein
MSGAIPPLPNTPSWCVAELRHRDTCFFGVVGGRTTPLTIISKVKKRRL